MPRTTRTAAVAVALAALLATACSTQVTGIAAPADAAAAPSAPSAGASPPAETTDAVGWVDEVCAALTPFIDTASVEPDVDPTDPDSAVQALSDYLGTAADSLGTTISQLDAVGPSPVEGGDEAVDQIVDALAPYQARFEEAKATIDSVDSSDPVALLEALPVALAPLQDLAGLEDPTTGLQDNPELTAAAEQAPSCRSIVGSG